jgi:CheY-like chemotaxis protein
MKILLAEPDPAAASLLGTHLVRSGHLVRLAGDAPQAVSMARTGSFDVLLMSVDRNGIDAAGLAVTLAAPGTALPLLPIVACMPYAVPEEAARCAAAGVDEIVTAPLGLDALVALMARTIERRHAAS